MCADDVAIQGCQFHLHADGEFVNSVNANPRAEEGWVEVDEAFAKTLVKGGHKTSCRCEEPRWLSNERSECIETQPEAISFLSGGRFVASLLATTLTDCIFPNFVIIHDLLDVTRNMR